MNKNLDKPNLKYTYKGVSLRSWCTENNVDYNSVCYQLNKFYRLGKELPVEIAITRALKRRTK